MNDDEFAFFNHQLAAMLRDGIPLEGALRRLCADLRDGALKTELQALEASLAKGTPLREAARAGRLPELYQRLLEVGAQSNDLPGVLTLLADLPAPTQSHDAAQGRWSSDDCSLQRLPALVFF
jgi:type II secretory pathway component PulF